MMEKLLEKWHEVLDLLEREFPAVSFDLWVKPLKPIAYNDGVITIEANSSAAKAFIIKNYHSLFEYTLKTVYNDFVSYKLLDDLEVKEFKKNQKSENIKQDQEQLKTEQPSNNAFNIKFKFKNFVVGKSNHPVYAASKAVSENPGTKFNPLFIYGGVGLGKTHLLHSIGSEIEEKFPEKKVVYVTCEKFTNDYIEALRINSVNSFRNKYRSLDVLLLDDIQFLINKTSTQEEFFHTFNDLYQNNKQIVLTSDRNPKELTLLEERLKSRFQSGLIQDIQSPEYETRLAILEKKVEIEQHKITKEALSYIAEKVDSNIRELEGFLQKVCFHATLLGKSEADVLDVADAFQDAHVFSQKTLTAEKICDCVCNYYNISLENLKGKKRNKEFVEPRQMAVYLICELMPDLPLASIGLIFNGRDHTTIIHSRDKVEQNIKTHTKIKQQFNDLKTIILENV